MITTLPEVTVGLMNLIDRKAREGSYELKLDEFRIIVLPFVFPPQSEFSASTRSIFKSLGNLKGKRVLDLGTGTGILALYAAKHGAGFIDAVDISENAIECARQNITSNGYGACINVFNSNLFSNIPSGKEYDIIIANLPILEYPSEKNFYSLFDPDYSFHKAFFSKVREFLVENGKIIMAEADLEKKGDFTKFEELAKANKFKLSVINKEFNMGHEWRCYELARGNEK